MGCSGTSIMEEKTNNEHNHNLQKDEEVCLEREIYQKTQHKTESEPMGEFDNFEEINEETSFDLNNIHILIKNLESKNIEPETIKNSIEKEFKEIKEDNIKKDDLIEKISNIFIEYLKPINNQNKEQVKYIIKLLYENYKELKDFKKILQESLENINNYNKIKGKEKNNINNSIIKSLHKNEKIINKKEELKKQYKKNNYIVKYNDFIQIIKENNIEMDKLLFEYLLYEMKCGLSLDGELSLENLNIKIFLDFLDKK